MNEYLQIHVIGKCWHIPQGVIETYTCNKCGMDADEHVEVYNRGYSDPTHYEALSSQLRNMGEWAHIQFFLTAKYNITTLRRWEEIELVDRIPLIHEYALSRGAEYWKEKRG